MRFLKEERGATAVFVAISLLMIMGFAALAIDSGLGFNERRQDQAAADAAVMAGALEFYNTPDEIINQVVAYSYENVESPPAAVGDWKVEFQNCVDPNRLDPVAGIVNTFVPLTDALGNVYDCISVADGAYLRVKLPITEVDTTFGKILGVDTIATDAAAIARIAPDGGGADIIPLAIPANAGSGSNCIRTGPGGTSQPPCDGPANGNFFMVDAPLKGNDDLGTTRTCTGSKSARFNSNLAVGFDHPVFPHQPAAPLFIDECDEEEPPNQLWTASGNGIDLRDALISNQTFTANGNSSRFQDTPFGTINLDDKGPIYPLDNRPLWAFLTPTDGSTCDASTYAALPTADDQNARLDACIGSAAGVIFSSDISNSPRYGFVPRWEESGWPNGTSSPRTIANFEPVFLNALYFNCSAGGCGLVFTPGEFPDGDTLCDGPPCKKLNNLSQMSAFIIPEALVPASARFDAGPNGNLLFNESWLYR